MENKKTIYKLDADESVFFERELANVEKKLYEKKYPQLKARLLIPADFSQDPGANSRIYHMYDRKGLAKIVNNYSDDIPVAEVTGTEHVSKYKDLASSFIYSIREIKAAAKAGKPLDQMKANAARMAVLEKEDKLAWSGDSALGIPGFLGNANYNSVTIPADGTGASALWSAKTPAQILRDMNLVANTVANVSNQAFEADTLLLPVAQYNYIASTARSDNSDTTILKYFLANNPYIKAVEPLYALKASPLYSNLDVILAYKRDEEILQLDIPEDASPLPPQPKNLAYKVPMLSRFGGCIVRYPVAFAVGSGI